MGAAQLEQDVVGVAPTRCENLVAARSAFTVCYACWAKLLDALDAHEGKGTRRLWLRIFSD